MVRRPHQARRTLPMPAAANGGASMKNGYRVYDADTHVNPAAEVLERYVDPDFRPRLAELAAHRRANTQVGGTPNTHQYRVGTKSYPRVLGEARAHETFTGRGVNWRGTAR